MIRNCYPSFVSRSSLLFLSLFSSSIDRVDARSQRTQPTRAILLWEDLNILTLVCALLFDIHFLFFSGFFFFTDTEKFVDGGKCQMYHCLYTDIHWPNNVRHPISLFSFFFIFSFTVSFIFSLHLLRDACYELYGASPDLSFWRETGVVSFFRLHFSCVDKKNKKVTRLSKCIVPYLSVSLSLSSSSSLPSKLSILALLVYICPRPGGDDRNYLFNTHSSDFHCFRCELFHYRPFSTMTWCRTD